MSNGTPPNEEEVSEANMVEAPNSSSPNSSPPRTPRKNRKQLPPLGPSPLSPSTFVKRKKKNLNISTVNHNHEQSLPLILPSPTDTVQTSDTCPLDLSLDMEEEDMHLHIIQNLDEEEQNLGGTSLDSPARRRAILTARRFQHWKDHSHAVGLAPVSWLEEWQEEYELMTTQTRTAAAAATDSDTTQDAQEPSRSNWKERMQFYGSNPSLLFCTRFQRVGNMVILMERKDWMQLSTRDDCAVPIGLSEEGNDNFNSNGNENTTEATSTSYPSRRFATTETRYTMVLGPYWSTLFCFTLPLITTLSIITATNAIFIPANLKSSEPSGCWIIATWTTLTLLLYLSLFYTSLVDPGILPRCKERPSKSNSNSGNWRWNDQAQSYIPPDAVYEPDCKVVIEGYHHTCVYTGTAIGKNNVWSFGAFMVLGFACLFMDVVLLSIMM